MIGSWKRSGGGGIGGGSLLGFLIVDLAFSGPSYLALAP